MLNRSRPGYQLTLPSCYPFDSNPPEKEHGGMVVDMKEGHLVVLLAHYKENLWTPIVVHIMVQWTMVQWTMVQWTMVQCSTMDRTRLCNHQIITLIEGCPCVNYCWQWRKVLTSTFCRGLVVGFCQDSHHRQSNTW